VSDWESIAQIAVGAALVCYGLYEGWKRLPKLTLPAFGVSKPADVNGDVHTVVNISIRLDAAGKARAADLARGLVQEMLSPAKKV
jgi:hypothetical protein